MKKILSLTDSINLGRGKKISVKEIIDSKTLFNYIKDGYEFEEKVLQEAGIKKTIRNEKIVSNIITNNKTKDKGVYQKDTKSVKEILKDINTINQDEEIDDFFMQEDDKNVIFVDE